MTVNLDADISNADWTKQTWDLVGIDTVPKLRAWLKSTKMSAAAFKRLPVYHFNVNKPGTRWLKGL